MLFWQKNKQSNKWILKELPEDCVHESGHMFYLDPNEDLDLYRWAGEQLEQVDDAFEFVWRLTEDKSKYVKVENDEEYVKGDLNYYDPNVDPEIYSYLMECMG
jgi:hypothetical protein